jgi:hypothetical protein
MVSICISTSCEAAVRHRGRVTEVVRSKAAAGYEVRWRKLRARARPGATFLRWQLRKGCVLPDRMNTGAMLTGAGPSINVESAASLRVVSVSNMLLIHNATLWLRGTCAFCAPRPRYRL